MDAVPLRIGLGVMAVILVGLAVLVGLRGRGVFHRYVPAELSGPVLGTAPARRSRGSAIRRRRRCLRASTSTATISGGPANATAPIAGRN